MNCATATADDDDFVYQFMFSHKYVYIVYMSSVHFPQHNIYICISN